MPLSYQPTWQTGIPEDILATGSVRVEKAGDEAYAPVARVVPQTRKVRQIPARQYIPSIAETGQELDLKLAGFDPTAALEGWWGDVTEWWTEKTAVWAGQQPLPTPQEYAAAGELPVVEAGIPMMGGLGAGLAGLAGLGGKVTLGFLRSLFAKYGPTLIKALVGGAAFGWIMSLIMGDDPDDKLVSLKKKPKRYTIGSNPRVRTLQKVARHCQRLLKRHEKVIREFLPKKQVRYGIPPAKALSAIEKAAIRG